MTDNEILETQLFEVVKNESNFDSDVVIARLEVLVALGVDVNVKDKDDRVALSYTNDERVRKYLILNGASVAEEGRGYFLEDIAKLSMEKENERQEIRNMFKSIGREVIFLKRIEMAGIKLGGLKRGEMRKLKDYEVAHLMRLTNVSKGK